MNKRRLVVAYIHDTCKQAEPAGRVNAKAGPDASHLWTPGIPMTSLRSAMNMRHWL
jgi:hypothetical protein